MQLSKSSGMLSLEFWWIIHAWNDGIDEKEFFSSKDIEIDGLDFAFLRGSQTQWDINYKTVVWQFFLLQLK